MRAVEHWFDKSDEAQEQRRVLISDMVNAGVFRSFTQGDPAVVEVRDAWMLGDFEDKKTSAAVVWMYLYRPIDWSEKEIELRDARTGRRVGTYEPSVGLLLD